MNKYIICNLKAHNNFSSMVTYKKKIEPLLEKDKKLILAPSYIFLGMFNGNKVSIASQDVSIYENGPYTGEVTANQLASLQIKYAFVSHSEQKKQYNEKETKISYKKIENALKENVTPIYFFETIEEIDSIYKKIKNKINKIILVYEPSETIGSENIKEIDTIKKIVEKVKKKYKTTVLYGGSINLENIENLKKVSILDGIILGRSSLEFDTLEQIYNIYKCK